MASYRRGIENIALNDEPLIMNAEDLIGMPSVHAIAEAFDKELDQVANDVIKLRTKFREQDQLKSE